MIEFATLLLGLVLGPHTIELSADETVAAIHVILDGETVAVIEDGPPWRAEIDLGSELRPRRLEAVSLDAAGRRLGRAQQRLNYLRPTHEIAITLGETLDEGERSGSLVWRAALDLDPQAFELRFDGEPVAVAANGSFVLPAHSLDIPHALEAVAVFPDGAEARAELAFGGNFGERVTSSLSPLALRSPDGKPWTAEELEGRIRRRGETVDETVGVFTANAAPRRVVVLRDAGTDLAIEGIGRRVMTYLGGATWKGEIPETFVTTLSPVPAEKHGGTFVFLDIPGASFARLGLGRTVLGRVRFDEVGRSSRERQRLWPALAVAGQRAAASRGPRAVFLIVDEGLDASAREGEPSLRTTLDFLESLRVPIVVWSLREAAIDSLGLGEDERAHHGIAGFVGAMEALETELATQTIVWVVGDHLPHELALANDLDWVR